MSDPSQDEIRHAPPERRRRKIQLRRLRTLMDVIYAIIIWRLFMLLPRPEGDVIQWSSIGAMLVAEWPALLMVTIGLAVTIIYWDQSNYIYGYLDITDSKHTTYAILQMFFLLFLLYAIKLGMEFDADVETRLLESVAAVMVGAMAWLGWRYAVGRGDMLVAGIPTEATEALSIRSLAEPAAALVTIPFAFIDGLAWELAWLAYLPIAYWLRRHSQWR
jgi:hypothetical protein